MDPRDEEDYDGYGHGIVEHSSMTTSIQSESEYRASCVKVNFNYGISDHFYIILLVIGTWLSLGM